ncbi:MAG: Ig-like domain-containing protein [Acidimicrobiia bacterium]
MSPLLVAPALADPTAVIGGPYPNPGIAGEPVAFDGTGSNGDSEDIKFFFWDFGDGSASKRDNKGSATHTYLKAGDYLVTLIVEDDDGETATATTTATIVEPNLPMPTVSISQPAPGATVGGTVSIVATTSNDARILDVQFLVDGVNIGADNNPPWSATWDSATSTNGQHTLTAIAADITGLTSRDSVSVTVDNNAPLAVQITDPVGGAVVSGIISIKATSESAARVQFFVDGNVVGTDLFGFNGWSAMWNTAGTSDGAHTIAATATSRQGQTATATITVTVNNSPTTTTTTTSPTTTTSLPATTTTTTATAGSTSTATTNTSATNPTTTSTNPTTTSSTPALTLEVLGLGIEATVRAIGLSATSFTVAPLALSPGEEITLTLQLQALLPGFSEVLFLLDGSQLGEPAAVTTGPEMTFTRVLPADLSVGQHRVEVVTDEDPPRVLASRSVGVAVSLGASTPFEQPAAPSSMSTTWLLPVIGGLAGAGAIAAVWRNRRRWLPRRTRP